MTDDPQNPSFEPGPGYTAPGSIPPSSPSAMPVQGSSGVPVGVDPNTGSQGAGTAAPPQAPNSELTPGRGLPLVDMPANSVSAPMAAGKLNMGFLVAGVVGLIVIVLIVVLVIHLI